MDLAGEDILPLRCDLAARPRTASASASDPVPSLPRLSKPAPIPADGGSYASAGERASRRRDASAHPPTWLSPFPSPLEPPASARTTTSVRNGKKHRYELPTPSRYYMCNGMQSMRLDCRERPYIRAERLEEPIWSEVGSG